MDPKELAAIEACQSGRPDRFGDLYDAYAEKIYRFIYFKTFHKETAEDLTSDVFMKALERIGQYDPSKGVFSAWLYRVARNTVIDHYRTSHASEDIDDGWDITSSTDIEREAHANLQLDRIRDAMKMLKPDQREILTMRLWDGLNHAEIADILNLSESNVKQIYSRTVRQLRKQFGEHMILTLILLALISIK